MLLAYLRTIWEYFIVKSMPSFPHKTNWQGFLSSSKKEGNRMVNLAAGYKRSNPYGTVGEVIPPPAPSKGGYASFGGKYSHNS